MSFRPPEVLSVLWNLDLRNGNQHRLQFVRFSDRPRAVVSLECREYVAPEKILDHRPPIQFTDENGWGMGLPKGMRAEHLEWLFDNREKVRATLHRKKIDTLKGGLDGWGRKKV